MLTDEQIWKSDAIMEVNAEFGFTLDQLRKIVSAVEAASATAVSVAERDLLAERRRQIEVEGYSAEHDAAHGTSELSLAAAAYALSSVYGFTKKSLTPWPWGMAAFRPKHPYRDLERAGALVLASMECWQRRFAKQLPSDRDFLESRRAASPAPAASKGAEAVASERCKRCGGRCIPWGYGKCHCFKTTEDTNDREHHGADAESAPQVGETDAGSDRSGAGSGANVGDEHRSAATACYRHAGYSLGDGVRLPDEAAIREAIDLTPTPEPIDWSLHSPTFAAPSEPEARKAVASGDVPLWKLIFGAILQDDSPLHSAADFERVSKRVADMIERRATPSPAASMEVQGLTTEESLAVAATALGFDGGHQEVHDGDLRYFSESIQRALAAKNGWKLEGQS